MKLSMALFFLLGIIFGSVSAAFAENHGAIAYDSGAGAWGASWDQPSKSAAEKEALDECKKTGSKCTVVVQFEDECGAYAAGDGDAAGWGTATTRSEAEKSAMKYCKEDDSSGCELKAWACNSKPDDCAAKKIEREGCEDRNRARSSRGDSYQETCPGADC